VLIVFAYLRYYHLTHLTDPRFGTFYIFMSILSSKVCLFIYLFIITKPAEQLPFSIRVLLESAVRSCDGFHVKPADIEKILDWKVKQFDKVEVPFLPSLVLLHDFTVIAAVV